jgi:hypothetical protein
MDKRNNGWENTSISYPNFLSKDQTGESLDRIYYRAKSPLTDTRNAHSIGICTLNIETLPYIYPTSTPTNTPVPTSTPTNTPVPTSTPIVTSTPVPVAGDANGDGRVDIADYVIWIEQYGNYNPTPNKDPDFNNDGRVDGKDYIIWLSNYGK